MTSVRNLGRTFGQDCQWDPGCCAHRKSLFASWVSLVKAALCGIEVWQGDGKVQWVGNWVFWSFT